MSDGFEGYAGGGGMFRQQQGAGHNWLENDAPDHPGGDFQKWHAVKGRSMGECR